MALRHPLRAVLRSDQVSGSVHALGAALGHEFTRPELLQQALTHPSATAKSTYERLEFLGDRVLGLVIADMVYRAYPAEPEGALARRFTALVRKEALARVAETIDLGSHLRVSRAEAEQGGRGSHNLLADACEAIIAALFLDGGFEVARRFVERWWQPLLAEQAEPPQDAKTALQEWAQGLGLPLPVYRLIASEGPPHDPTFEMEVSLPGRTPAQGRGRSRRAAESAAANALFSLLKDEPRD
jgi:ribonuclease III